MKTNQDRGNSAMQTIEEYKTLRDEIGRYQNHISNAVQVGVTLSTAIIAGSFFKSEYGWMLICIPSFLLIPSIFYIKYLNTKIWIIGRYIEFYIEPSLDLHWETFSRKYFGDPIKKSRTRYVLTTGSPLLSIQLLCPLFSWAYYCSYNFIPMIWLYLYLVIICIVIFETIFLFNFKLQAKAVEEIYNTINQLKTEHC